MFFVEKLLSQDANYKSIELLNFVQLLLKESRSKQARLHSLTSNYGWLQSRPADVDVDLEKYRTMLLKLSSASCAAIAVQMDRLTEECQSVDDILMMFENFINEQTNMEIIENNIKKEKKRKIYPELVSDSRRSSLSFITN
ncbi:uncharacterized protein LOC133319783 [Danaus plexippus]|uniref:uncharacterized protein LOC133319783 n=1 Tax=Danaus plexippus TaxID=13037 RepID=UPI002AB195D7|nr:uncharacterized protein LOC133319783 [Danaus plexippus]